MRVLILGGDGMLGHRIYRSFKEHFEVMVSLSRPLEEYSHLHLYDSRNAYGNIRADNFSTVEGVLRVFKPNVVVNAIGIVKQRSTAEQAIPSIQVNSLFPHRLAAFCGEHNARLIHFSTDCVFSGRKGMYTEEDCPDARDLYGLSKLLGEVADHNCLTIRSSIIGRELNRAQGLVEWFLAQRGRVKGYSRAIFSGLTTHEMARVVLNIILNHPAAQGLWHVSSEPISKFDLLTLIRDSLGLNIEIEKDSEIVCNRSLDSTRFRTTFNYTPPSWEEMIAEMHL